jgi:integrase
MISSISEKTRVQYTTSLKLWWEFCCQRNVDFYDFKISLLLEFLTNCFKKGSSYGTLNSHRSAISLISSNRISDNLSLKRFSKGIFRLKPTFPRYTCTWDVNVVLNYLESMNNDAVNLEQLSKKLVMLLALTTGQRMQTLSFINMSNIKVFEDRIVINITNLIKTSSIGKAQPILNLPFFRSRPGICPASALQKYVLVTSPLRSNTEEHLILSYKKPHRSASSQSLGRWIKQTLTDSGIDTSIFTAHSTRHASTSAASRAGLSVDAIRKSAGWTERSAVFANFYNRPIINSEISLLDSVFQ